MKREAKAALTYMLKSARTVLTEAVGHQPPFEYLFWEITDACNSRCSNCNIWRVKPSRDVLKPEEVERLFSSGFFKDVKDVIISGGEPVLLPYLEENLLIMRKHIMPNASVSLSTNGLLPDRVIRTTKNCIKHGMKMIVGVSLDGIGEHHDLVRGVKGNFEKVDYLLKELKKLKEDESYANSLKVTIGYTFSPTTFHYFEEVRDYAESLGMYFLPQMYEEFSYYSNTDRQTSYSEDMIEAAQDMPPSFQKELILRCLRKAPIAYKCCSMRKFFVLHCNGDISPCLRFAHVKVGNIRDLDVTEVWTGDKVRNARALVDACKGCSNTWATGWSMRYWMPPFFKMLSSAVIKKHIARTKGPKTAKESLPQSDTVIS